MKTWLLVVTVVAILLAASVGIALRTLNNMKAELSNIQAELSTINTTLAQIRAGLHGTEDDSPPTYILSVSINPPQAGSVSPLGGQYQSGSQVTVTASPATGYSFGYWSGSESGTASTITVTIDSSKNLTANFAPVPSGITWDEAKNHIGERVTENNPVYGPVVGTSYRPDIGGQPTWLNIGEDYPSQNRFVVIIWGDNRGDFPQAPEDYYLGKTIYVTGLIEYYGGVAEIQVASPDQIHE